jgi:hypothetical protein
MNNFFKFLRSYPFRFSLAEHIPARARDGKVGATPQSLAAIASLAVHGPKLISQILKGAEGQTDERYADSQSSEREVALTVDSAPEL